jgi:ferredoxin-type protein NapH
MANAQGGSWYRWNFVSRMAVLLLVPTLFRWLNFAFMWHSIYWGAVTVVMLIWGGFILLSPLLGRLGCGWFCFMGTVQDLADEHAFFRVKHGEPVRWAQFLTLAAFFVTAGICYHLNVERGLIHGWRFAPFHLDNVFDVHYKRIWIYDTFGALIFGLLLHKRWTCKHLCAIGGACALGARLSRLVLTLDPSTCSGCSRCERVCPVAIPILDTVKRNRGLIAHSECLLCGKCKDACAKDSLAFELVWNRKRRAAALPELHASRLEGI